MSQIEKLIEKFRVRPESLSYRDLHKVLTFLGCIEVQTKGSHVKWKHTELQADIIIPVHNNDCKDFYKRHARKMFDSILKLQ
ncbi:MAG: HicA toxin of bacterial toxin-antitoxin [Candidatus Parcubacteria bacterium]|jgi:predicted RNA binding protein YcfA (HicA-like mRNA interferase family)